MKTKHWILTANIPGGRKKGEIVTTQDGKQFYWEDFEVCQWNPKLETSFFKEYVKLDEPIANVTEYVTYKPQIGFKRFNGIAEVKKIHNRQFANKAYYEFEVQPLGSNKTYKISESNLMKSNQYWFISSGGKVHAAYNTNEPEDRATAYRQLTNNYFKTKELAVEKLKSVFGE